MLIDPSDIWDAISYAVPVPFVVVVFCTALAVAFMRGKRERAGWMAALLAYIAAVVWISLVYGRFHGFSYNLVPFGSLSNLVATEPTDVVVRQIFLNLLFFAPLGFLLPLATRRFTRFRAVVLAAVCGAVGIEALQFITASATRFTSNKTVDVDNVILDVLGAWIGYGLFLLFRTVVNAIGASRARPSVASQVGSSQ